VKGFRFLVDSKVVSISDAYAQRHEITIEDSMKLFLGSATYRVLNDAEKGILEEFDNYVYGQS